MQTTWKSTLAVMLGALVFAGNACARIQVQVPAVLDPRAPIAESVKRECNVEQAVGNSVFQKISELNNDAVQLAKPEDAGVDPFIKLTLLEVNGVGGGRMSGRKNITLRVNLLVKGRVIATKQFMRGTSVMGFAVSGTCSLMESIADALGKDVAKWIPNAIRAIPAILPDAPTASVNAKSTQSQINQHRRQIPFATSFAMIDNVDALPSNEEGRANYRQYLSMPSPKAFVVYSTGSTRAYSNDPDAMTKSLDTCVDEGKACWLYAVDDRVVWSADEGLRIGLSARLQKK
ncbi:MAG: hypothetical protein ACXWJD_00720 [Burkholderiaceae bacterium]